MTTWRQQFLVEIIDFCNARGSRGFILQEFTDERLGFLQAFRPSKNAPQKFASQFLDEGLLTFVNNNGFYTLRGLALLEHEMEAINAIDLGICAMPNRRLWQKAAPLLPERAPFCPKDRTFG